VIVGLKFGVRVTVALYVFEVVLLLALSLTILVRGGANGRRIPLGGRKPPRDPGPAGRTGASGS
jgi:hypothetical protein